MRLGNFVKSPDEVKRYTVDYVSWLDAGEYISSVTFGVTPAASDPIVALADALGPEATTVTYYISGGSVGTVYTLLVQVATTAGQIKEDTVLYSVRSPE